MLKYLLIPSEFSYRRSPEQVHEMPWKNICSQYLRIVVC